MWLTTVITGYQEGASEGLIGSELRGSWSQELGQLLPLDWYLPSSAWVNFPIGETVTQYPSDKRPISKIYKGMTELL